MRITIDGFDENLFKRKQTSTNRYGTIRSFYRLLSKFAVIMMKCLAGDR